MNRFAELLDRLAYEPGRNNKLRLITAYFREVGDPDRGYALAALTGALSFKHAKPGLIRDLIADRTDPMLFALSYDYVGDLSETVALMWPKSSPPLATRSGGDGQGGGYTSYSLFESLPSRIAQQAERSDLSLEGGGDKKVAREQGVTAGHNNPPPPTLSDVVTTLRTLGKTELPRQLARWLDDLDETGRWAL